MEEISEQKQPQESENRTLKLKDNFKLLSKKQKVRLIVSLCMVLIPLLAYSLYCGGVVLQERVDTIDKYVQGSDDTEVYNPYDKEQAQYHNDLMLTDREHSADAIYCDVVVGARLYRISDISYSTNSYVTRMEIYFTFDKEQFHAMFKTYSREVLNYLIYDEYVAENPGRDPKTNSTYQENGQFSVIKWLDSAEGSVYADEWADRHAREYYPGETPSNVLTEKQTMFDVGNGGFVADSYGTVKDLEEVEYVGEDGKLHTACYQKVKFEAKFEKAFDSHRYPLDSIQLKMYIQPTMDAKFIRYTPDRAVNQDGEPLSGFGPFFTLTNGYRLIKENEKVSNFTQNVHYYRDVNNDPATSAIYPYTYKTQLEVIVRANRSGISLFLQAFVNLFSVIIWIVIAFYNQSHNGDDSIGMLGTGLFGAISSILVGISMVSDAGLFSLITMINIFTLAVILIMAYQSITARRANVKQDETLIAFNAVKLKVTFYMLCVCIVIMFVGLPITSYLFGY